MLVLIILAAVWAAVLVPPMLRSRRQGSPDNSVVSFRAQLSTLERATPGTSLRDLPPGSASIRGMSMATSAQQIDPRRRRRDVLVGLLAATSFSFLLFVAFGGTFTTFLFLLSIGATGAYVYALRQMHVRSTERHAKVRPLRRPEVARPAMAMRRAAN